MDAISISLLCTLTWGMDGRDIASEQSEPASGPQLALRAGAMWRGYNGSADPKPGLLQHSDGLWYPRRAFEIGCSKSEEEENCVLDHRSWCHANYWSYRASDDTFQPYLGKRLRCISPYGK